MSTWQMTLKKQPRCSLLCDSSQAVPGWAVRPSRESHVVTGGHSSAHFSGGIGKHLYRFSWPRSLSPCFPVVLFSESRICADLVWGAFSGEREPWGCSLSASGHLSLFDVGTQRFLQSEYQRPQPPQDKTPFRFQILSSSKNWLECLSNVAWMSEKIPRPKGMIGRFWSWL